MSHTDEYKINFQFLEQPVKISEQRWEADVRPFVSISCITYNHEKYIRDAFEGFLMQETTFPVEILVHDDASTDSTSDIIREYESRYPAIFRVIYQTENQYSKKVKIGFTYQYPRVRGKYYATCEGDDYWIDPLKLQKQVNFLESHTDYALVCGGFIEDREGVRTQEIAENISSDPEDECGFSFTLEDLKKKWVAKTLTAMFRGENIKTLLNNFRNQLGAFEYFRDTHVVQFMLSQGKGFYMKEVLGVYNIHPGGVNSMKDLDHKYNVAFKVRRDIYYHDPNLFNTELYLRKSLRLMLWNIQNRKNISSIMALLAESVKTSFRYLALKFKN